LVITRGGIPESTRHAATARLSSLSSCRAVVTQEDVACAARVMRWALPVALLLLAAKSGPAAAAVRMPAFFGHNMVLQTRSFGGTRAFLSGWAAAGERVTVREGGGMGGGGEMYYATAGTSGSWSLQLDPRPYSGGGTSLTVTGSSGGPAAIANNVTFGDVIICAGGAAMASPASQLITLPENVRVFVVGTGSTQSPPPPGRSDVPPGSVGWSSAPRAVSALCVQTAAELSALRKSTPIGLIVAAVPGSSLLDWVPASAATRCLSGANQQRIGQHYNAMINPFSMTSTRAAWWALDEPANATVGEPMVSATNQACLFRAMINSWRDAQPTGDYSFIFAQSRHSTASAIAQAAALPQPTVVSGRGAKHGCGGFPNDKQAVDSTGVAIAEDSGEQLARRMALSMVHVAFAQQPSSSYAGPTLSSATVVDSVDAASVTATFHFGAVAPGRLLLQPVTGCSRGCCGNEGGGLDLRLATSADLSDPSTTFIRATAVTVLADGAALHALFGVRSNSLGQYPVAMLVGGSECAVVGSASNISAVVSAVAIDIGSASATAATATGVADADDDADTTLAAVGTRGQFASPPLGWNHWNAFHCDVSERLVVAMADAMIASGMAAAGFQYINLDDCWMVERGANGSITPDPVRFPSGIKALADYIHSKGLKFGIYQAPGNPTPQGRPGLLDHEAQDVATFCEWGVDYIKLDSKGSTREGWNKVRTAINACTRQPMYLQVAFCKTVAGCDGWMDRLANAWRTSGDSQATWASVMNNMDSAEPLWPLAGPTGPIGGHWNDAECALNLLPPPPGKLVWTV
jgi:hypothetical protein